MNKRRISSNVLNWLNTFKRNRKISSGKKITNIELRYYAEMLFPALISVIAGYYLWRYKLASPYSTEIPNFLLVSALFFAITAVYTMLIGITEILRGRIYSQSDCLSFKKVLIIVVVGSICTGIIAGVCEILYELNGTDYDVDIAQETMLVIDDSSSMKTSDKNDRRLTAANELLEHIDGNRKVGLIRFSKDIHCYIPMDYLKVNKSTLNHELENKAKEGGTDINGALYAVLNAFDKAGTATGSRSVILLTDGKSTINVDEEYLINRANSMNIQINVISLGNHTDKAFIKRITSSTGGKAAKTSSDFYLDAAYGVFLGSHIERCLLVPLIVGYHTAGQILLQILLIAIICITSQAVPTILLRYHSYINWHIKLSPVMILIGAASLAIRDASFSAICFLLVLYLMPFFKGRVKARKLKIRHKKKPHKSRSIPHYTRGDKGYEMMEYYESHNIYDKNIGAFENRNHYTR